jgi:DNA replication ATP-dependent helicase Dna2
MMYVTAELSSPQHTNVNEGVQHSHGELLQQYTGHLSPEEITYFRDWDRLIDLEADATTHNTATVWLQDSTQREKESGESVSSLVFDGAEPSSNGDASYILIGFRRSLESTVQTPLSDLGLAKGSYLIISTDATSFHTSASSDASGRNLGSGLSSKRRFRHQMHVVRGTIDKIEFDRLLVRASREDLERIRGLALRYKETNETSDGLRRTDLLFRIDKDRFSSGMSTLRQNLINFMTGGTALEGSKEPTEEQTHLQQRLSWLRDVIVRLRSPVYIEYNPSIFTTNTSTPQLPGCDLESLAFEYAELNPDQRAAVEKVSLLFPVLVCSQGFTFSLFSLAAKVFCARDYTLLQGLPGTGKTSTLAFVARLLAAHGRRVLITSYTHAAVDNVVLKLMGSGLASTHEATGLPPLVRIGQRSSCHLDVRPVMVSELARKLERKTANAELRGVKGNFANEGTIDDSELPSATSLRTVVSSARIVCISALSVPRSPLLTGEPFDVVIVDEAGQIGQPAILGALMAADSFVLVGDHLQLPPLVNSEIAELGGEFS